MSAVSIQQLNNAALDCEHIEDLATSDELTATDRLGRSKLTMQGALASLGYQVPVAYAAGISLTAGTQAVEHNGAIYAPIISALPFTTSGTFEEVSFRPIQVDRADFIRLDVGTVAQAIKHVTPQMFGAVGDGVADDGPAIRAAIAYAAGVCAVVFPPGEYLCGEQTEVTDVIGYKRIVRIPSNSKLVFEAGAKIKAKTFSTGYYAMMLIASAENIEIIRPHLIGDNSTNPYDADAGMGILMYSAWNVHIDKAIISDTAGDAIYIGRNNDATADELAVYGLHCRNVVIDNPRLANCRRQGISLVTGEDVFINDPVISGISGKNPQAGIDIEPDHPDYILKNIRVTNASTKNCSGAGIQVFLSQLDSSSQRVDVVVDGHKDEGSFESFRIVSETQCKGAVIVNDAIYQSPTSHSVYVASKRADGVRFVFNDTDIVGVTTAYDAFHLYPENSTAKAYAFGGIEVNRPSVRAGGAGEKPRYAFYAGSNNYSALEDVFINDPRKVEFNDRAAIIDGALDELKYGFNDSLKTTALNTSDAEVIVSTGDYHARYTNSGVVSGSTQTFRVSNWNIGSTYEFINYGNADMIIVVNYGGTTRKLYPGPLGATQARCSEHFARIVLKAISAGEVIIVEQVGSWAIS